MLQGGGGLGWKGPISRRGAKGGRTVPGSCIAMLVTLTDFRCRESRNLKESGLTAECPSSSLGPRRTLREPQGLEGNQEARPIRALTISKGYVLNETPEDPSAALGAGGQNPP